MVKVLVSTHWPDALPRTKEYITTRGFDRLQPNMDRTDNQRFAFDDMPRDAGEESADYQLETQSNFFSSALSMTSSDAGDLNSDSITWCTTPAPSEAGSDISLAVLRGHDDPAFWDSSSEGRSSITESSEENDVYMTIYYQYNEEESVLTGRHTFIPVDHPYDLRRELDVRHQGSFLNLNLLRPHPELTDGNDIVNFRRGPRLLRRLMSSQTEDRLNEKVRFEEWIAHVEKEHGRDGRAAHVAVKIVESTATTSTTVD